MHSKKALAVMLSKLKSFEFPDPSLEQYSTDSEVAATILWDAHLHASIEKKTVADLGCGTGILGIGALALGATHVTFLDKDPRVFPILMENLAKVEELTGEKYTNYDILEGDISTYTKHVDIVIQNPPFGTRARGADVRFLKKAVALAPITYSLHKTSTKDYLTQLMHKEGRHATILGEFHFPLKQTMRQHKSRIKRIDVFCLRIET